MTQITVEGPGVASPTGKYQAGYFLILTTTNSNPGEQLLVKNVTGIADVSNLNDTITYDVTFTDSRTFRITSSKSTYARIKMDNAKPPGPVTGIGQTVLRAAQRAGHVIAKGGCSRCGRR